MNMCIQAINNNLKINWMIVISKSKTDILVDKGTVISNICPVDELNHRRVINDVDVIKHLFVVYLCDNKSKINKNKIKHL